MGLSFGDIFHNQKLWTAILASISPTVIIFWSIVRILTLFSDRLYERINDALFANYMKVFLFFFEYNSIRKVYLYGDLDYAQYSGDRCIFMANHLSTADWFICSMLIARQKCLGSTRFILHKNLKYIPIFGFYLTQASCLFVDRGNFQVQKATDVLSYLQRMKDKLWIIIYPEGKRFNPEMPDTIAESQEFAIKKNMKPFRHVLTPKTRGFQMLVNHFRDYIDVVYDVSVIYADEHGRPLDHNKRVPQMTSWFHKRHCLHIHINRIPINDLPSANDELSQWLFSRFRIKEELFGNIRSRFYMKPRPSGDTYQKDTPNGCASYLNGALPNNGELDYGSTLQIRMKTCPVTLDTIQAEVVNCLPDSLSKRSCFLPPLQLMDLLPSLLLFYGFTLLWVFSFGWYGPLSFVSVTVVGTLLGEWYVHYHL